MSTLENQLLMEYSDRIAAARGAVQWNMLWSEIEASPLAPDDKESLKNLITRRLEQERTLLREQNPPAAGI